MEIRDYLFLIRKWLWLSLLCLLLAGGSAYLESSQSIKIYRATAVLLISQSQRIDNPNLELSASERLARTYAQRLASSPVVQETLERLGLPEGTITSADIAVQFVPDTQLIRVSVEHPSPEIAQLMANTLPEVFSERDQLLQSARYADSKSKLETQLAAVEGEIATIEVKLSKEREANAPDEATIARLEEQLIQLRNTLARLLQSYEASHQDTIILDVPAERPRVPVKPRTLQTTLLAAIIGAILGLGTGLFIEGLDDSVKPNINFARTFGVEPLAFIGRDRTSGGSEEEGERVLVSRLNQRSPMTEAFRMLRTNIRFASVDQTLQTVLITSPGPNEGKSTTAANLAVVMAQVGQRVILVDADLRRPVIHQIFKSTNQAGLTTALVERSLNIESCLQESSIEGLRVLTSGPLPPNPPELLASQRMQDVLSELQELADLVIIDTPPVLVVSDSSILSSFVSGVLLVLRANSTRIEATQQALKQLEGVQAKILGLVLNDVHGHGLGYYYYSDYYYSEESDSDSSDSGSSRGAKDKKSQGKL